MNQATFCSGVFLSLLIVWYQVYIPHADLFFFIFSLCQTPRVTSNTLKSLKSETFSNRTKWCKIHENKTVVPRAGSLLVLLPVSTMSKNPRQAARHPLHRVRPCQPCIAHITTAVFFLCLLFWEQLFHYFLKDIYCRAAVAAYSCHVGRQGKRTGAKSINFSGFRKILRWNDIVVFSLFSSFFSKRERTFCPALR